MQNRLNKLLSVFGLGLVMTVAASAQTASPLPTPEVITNAAELPKDLPDIAPNFTAPVRPMPSADRVGVEVADQKALSLHEAVELALRNSNDIETSQVDVKLAEFNLKSTKGVYDPRLVTENYFQKSKLPTASSLGGVDGSTTSTGFVNSVGVQGQSPVGGGSYNLNFRTSRDTTNNPFNSLNPQFPSALSFTYTQPLLRGLKTDNNRRQIEIAKKNLSLSDALFRQRSIEIITGVERAYWDLTFALKNLQVQTDAVKQARSQLESNKRQVDEGVIAPIEIVEAEAQVTRFEQQVYSAQWAVTQAENMLKSLLLPESGDPMWTKALVPTTPVNIEPPTVTVEDALAAARQNRPEFTQLQASKEINEINTRFFKDQAKPKVDLIASYTTNGLAGTELASSGGLTSALLPLYDRVNQLSEVQNLPPLTTGSSASAVPPQLVGGYGQSLSNLFKGNYPTYQVGVRIELPFGNRTAKANLGYSLAEKTKIEAQTAQQDQVIKAEVQNALQAVKAAEAALNAAAATRSSTEKLYQSEKNKLDNGTTTVYLLMQRQQSLVEARGRELQAQTDLNKALSNLQRATGTTFQSHNIEVKQVSSNKRLTISTPAVSDLDTAGFSKTTPRTSPAIGQQ